MPVVPLPVNPNLDHLRNQAKDLLRAQAAGDPQVAQRIREFHPRFHLATDSQIFSASLSLADAQLTIARERGFPSWARLKIHVEHPAPVDDLALQYHERIADATFRHAVDLLDQGNVAELSAWLAEHPALVQQQVLFEGGNYFRNPTLLEFIAENPIRHGTLPPNIVHVGQAILDAGADRNLSAVNETLGLVCSGRVPRECRVQRGLIDLLCERGADPHRAMSTALVHGEFDAVEALIARGACLDLAAAAAMGRLEEFRQLLPNADSDARHRALALAAQFGHTAIVRFLLDAGEDPNRYNPLGFHSHSTPLHQAALGHAETARLLVERGARLDTKDTMWQATPAQWARHEGHEQIEHDLLEAERRNPDS